jgi:hypothetical protein
MANAIYPTYKEFLLTGAGVDMGSETAIKCALIDTGTVAYSAAHNFYDDISAGVVGTPVVMTTTTTTSGTFDAVDTVFTSVSGATVEAVVIYHDTGTPSTSKLIAWLDTGFTTLPVTPNGGNITITWNASGIFTL